MQDFKHLYNQEPKVSQWIIIRDGCDFPTSLFHYLDTCQLATNYLIQTGDTK